MQPTQVSNSLGSMALFRFSKAEWHSCTMNSETLRLTPIEEWSRLEGEHDARGDAWEGATRIDQPKDIKSVKSRFAADPSGQWYEHKLAGPIVHRGGSTDFPATHAICFNMLTNQSVKEAISNGKNVIDLGKFHKEFGPSLLCIEDVPKFLELVIHAIRQFSYAVEASSHGPVKYVDPEIHSGAYDAYHKPKRFEWQQEFRIVVSAKNGRGKPLFLHVPGLRNVCKMIVDLEPNVHLIRNDDGSNSVSISQTKA